MKGVLYYMDKIKLKEIFTVDTLSQDKGWKKVRELIGNIDKPTVINFSGINVIEPWQCSEFRQLLQNENLHFEFINNLVVVNKVKMACVLEGLDENRIINIEIAVPKPKTPEEIKTEKTGRSLIPLFEVTLNEDGEFEASFSVSKKYTQIQSSNTILYIDYAIRDIAKVQGIKKFTLDFGDLVTLNNVLNILADIIVSYEKQGILIDVLTNSTEMEKNLKLFIHILKNDKYSIEERYEIITEALEDKLNMPGILIRYKKSKAVDDFGRHGHGEVVSSRICLIENILIDSDINNKEFRNNKYYEIVVDRGDGIMTLEKRKMPVLKVVSFDGNLFYPKLHWELSNEGDHLTSLGAKVEYIGMDEIGFCDEFLGSQYHFILPIQRYKKESKAIIVDTDENGRNIKRMCTIPERMQLVFDDWNIPYHKETLEYAIEQSLKNIENQE